MFDRRSSFRFLVASVVALVGIAAAFSLRSNSTPPPEAPSERRPAQAEPTDLPSSSTVEVSARAATSTAVSVVVAPPLEKSEPALARPAPPPAEPAPTAEPVRPRASRSAAEPVPSAPPVVPPAPIVESPSLTVAPHVGLDLWLALGANYVQYNERLFDVNTSYRDFRGPSVSFGMGMEITEATKLEVSYKDTPLMFDNTSVGLSNTYAHWQSFSIEGSSLGSGAFADARAGRGRWSWRWGMQLHQLPLSLFENGTNVPTTRSIQMFDASLGVEYVRLLNEFTRFSYLQRLQYPLSASASSAGAAFKVRPVLLFDGSLGFEKRFLPRTWAGFFWYGQFQSLKFDFDDGIATASGTHSVLFSNAEIRLTFDF